MSKKLYDWESDPELSTKSNIIPFPNSNPDNNNMIIQDDYAVDEVNDETSYYSPSYYLMDEDGRKYFVEHDEMLYVDDLNNVYHICVNDQNEVEEYIILPNGDIGTFVNKAHTLLKNKQNYIYEYERETGDYVYNPNLVYMEDNNKKR